MATDVDSPMVQMFQTFPRESATVMQRGIELGVVCNVLLVLDCGALVCGHWSATSRVDVFLGGLCMLRLLLVAPRPYFWWRTWSLFRGAALQRTSMQVASRLVDIYAHPFAMERSLLLLYYAWLVIVTALVCFLPDDSGVINNALRRHCIMSIAGIILHRIICVALFATLVQKRHRRNVAPPDALEKYTETVSWSDDTQRTLRRGPQRAAEGETAEQAPRPKVNASTAVVAAVAGCEGPESCSICLACYNMGEQLRVLRCGHYYHSRCVDTWLLKHKSVCPLCLFSVGPAAVPG